VAVLLGCQFARLASRVVVSTRPNESKDNRPVRQRQSKFVVPAEFTSLTTPAWHRRRVILSLLKSAGTPYFFLRRSEFFSGDFPYPRSRKETIVRSSRLGSESVWHSGEQ